MRNITVVFLALLTVLIIGVSMVEAQETILIGVNIELTGYSADQGTEQYRGMVVSHQLQPTITVGDKTYKVELAVCDNQSQREEAANCATRLIGQGVVGVIGGFASSMALAAAPIMQEQSVVQISSGSTNPVTTQIGDFIFRIPFTDDYQGQAIASYLYNELGARRIVLFRQVDDDHSVGITRIIVDTFERLGGQTQVQSFNHATVDFSAQLNNARRFNPDALVTTAFCTLAGPLVRQARGAGLMQQWIGGDSLDATGCVELGGQAFEGVLFTGFPDLMQLSPDAAERAASVKERYFEMYPDSVSFGGVTLGGSDAYGVMRAAIEAALAGGADLSDVNSFRIAVRDALSSTVDYPGVTGNLTYVDTDGTPASRIIGLLRVENVQPNNAYDRVPQGYFIISPDGADYFQGE